MERVVDRTVEQRGNPTCSIHESSDLFLGPPTRVQGLWQGGGWTVCLLLRQQGLEGRRFVHGQENARPSRPCGWHGVLFLVQQGLHPPQQGQGRCGSCGSSPQSVPPKFLVRTAGFVVPPHPTTGQGQECLGTILLWGARKPARPITTTTFFVRIVIHAPHRRRGRCRRGPGRDFNRVRVVVGTIRALGIGHGTFVATDFIEQSNFLGLSTGPHLALGHVMDRFRGQSPSVLDDVLKDIVIAIDGSSHVLLHAGRPWRKRTVGRRQGSRRHVFDANPLLLRPLREIGPHTKDANTPRQGLVQAKNAMGMGGNVIAATGGDMTQGYHHGQGQGLQFLRYLFAGKNGTARTDNPQDQTLNGGILVAIVVGQLLLLLLLLNVMMKGSHLGHNGLGLGIVNGTNHIQGHDAFPRCRFGTHQQGGWRQSDRLGNPVMVPGGPLLAFPLPQLQRLLLVVIVSHGNGVRGRTKMIKIRLVGIPLRLNGGGLVEATLRRGAIDGQQIVQGMPPRDTIDQSRLPGRMGWKGARFVNPMPQVQPFGIGPISRRGHGG